MPLWNSDMQLAFGPHPILLHARIQDPWWQVSFLLQSWSLTHCGLASTVKQKWFMHLKKQVTMSKVTSFTIATISSKCAFWTNTCNTSYRCLCVSDNTLLGWRTWVAHNTRIQASFSHAGELWRTVSINSAFWFFWYHSWKNMQFESQGSTGSLFATTYAQHKIHGHLQSKDICRCKPLCDLWHYIQHLEHSCLVCKEADILFWWNHCQEQSHTFQW